MGVACALTLPVGPNLAVPKVARRFAIHRTFQPQSRGADLNHLLYVRRALAAYPGVLEVPKVVLALPETPTPLLSG